MIKTNNHKKKLLIVEDEADLSELVAEKFDNEGFGTLVTATAEEGMEIALKDRPDLILLDIILPKMDGITMLKMLRKDSWGRDVPVIILSNVIDQDKVSQAMKFGVYDYIVKTDFVLNDLVKQVKEVLAF